MKKPNKTLFILSLLIFSATLLTTSCGNATAATPVTTEVPRYLTLRNGVQMPIIGFGTMSIGNPDDIATALRLGYRLIDTATIYGNEAAVGEGIRRSGIDRSEIFIATKVWVDDSGYEETRRAFARQLELLGVEYIDLYMIHRPRGRDVQGSWRAIEELYKAGKIRAIGVSNFEPHQLDELKANARIMPMMNQIEAHPLFQQYEAQADLEARGMVMQGWSPFISGRGDILSNPVLIEIGEQYNKTAAQVILRWLVQRGVAVIPRTNNPEHMAENLDIFDFELTPADIARINALDLNRTAFPDWN